MNKILVTLLFIAVVIAGGWFVWQNWPKTQLVVNNQQNQNTSDETVSWKVYNKDGFITFKYPNAWTVGELFEVDKSGNYTLVVTARSENYQIDTKNFFLTGGSELEVRKENIVNPQIYIDNYEKFEDLVYGNFKYYDKNKITDVKKIVVGDGMGVIFNPEVGDSRGVGVKDTEAGLLSQKGSFYRVRFLSKEANSKEILNQILSTFKFLPQK